MCMCTCTRYTCTKYLGLVFFCGQSTLAFAQLYKMAPGMICSTTMEPLQCIGAPWSWKHRGTSPQLQETCNTCPITSIVPASNTLIQIQWSNTTHAVIPSLFRLCNSTSAYCNIIISCYHVIWESNQQFNSLPHNNLINMMPAFPIKNTPADKIAKKAAGKFWPTHVFRYDKVASCCTCALCVLLIWTLIHNQTGNVKPDNKAAARTALTCKTAINCKQLTVMWQMEMENLDLNGNLGDRDGVVDFRNIET